MADTAIVTKNYIPQIDYLSRDYTAILADLTAIAKQFNPTWSVSDPSDIGVALLEVFAYLGDILSFYTDRMASEGFIGTASQRASILQIASMLGYTPTPSSAATVSISVKNNAGSSVTIPALSQISSTTVVNGQNTKVTFELDSAITISSGGTASATATQGITTTDEDLGSSNGTPSQYFKISQTGVIINSSGSSIKVKVGGANGVYYTYVSSLVDASPYDAVFTTTMDSDGYTYIVFGDGVAGKIPPAAYSVYVTYRVGVGSAGNIPLGSLESTFTNTNVNATITQLNAATGGADDESTDSIRINAPRALRTLRRAVSLKDYAYLALQVSGVSKANADSSVWSNVNLYIAPFGSSAVGTSSFTGSITGVTKTAKDGTSGSGYLKYAAAAGAFSSLVANSSYVTISGLAPNLYNINIPTMVAYVAGDGSFFTVATAYTTFPSFSSSLSSSPVVTASGTTTTEFNSLKTNVQTYFMDKVAPNVSLNIYPPTYVPINLDLNVRVLPQYTQSSVVAQIQNSLSSLVSYSNSFFADRITPHLISSTVSNIDGVDYVSINHLRKLSNEQVFYVWGWNRPSTTSVNLYVYNTHTVVAGSLVKVSNIDSTVDGTYGVSSVNGNTITINTPANINTTAVTRNPSSTVNPGATSIPVSNTTGITSGMLVISSSGGIPVGTTVGTVVTNSSFTISGTVSSTIATTDTLTFANKTVSEDNYVKVLAIDSDTTNGVATAGIVCKTNEMPLKGTFTVTATGGL